MNDSTSVVAIVDDTSANLRLLRTLLSQEGYRILCFNDGSSALKAFSKQVPDLVLMDVNMPKMNGHEACRQMKEDPQLQHIPVIFISALSDTMDIVRGFEVGGADYITKPFRMEEVIARVRTHISNHDLQRSLKESYEKVVNLEAMRESLVHMIVHDIRSPLAAVGGYAELCQRKIENGELPFLRDIKMIHGSAMRIGLMLEDMLTIKSVEEKGLPIKCDTFDLVPVCGEIQQRYQTLYKLHEIELTSPDGGCEISADQMLICRVVENLLINALKYSPSKSKVCMAIITAEDGAVEFSVSDEGPGIPDEDKDRIFDKYFKVESPQGPRDGSIGLGLAFCRLAVEAHQGSIGVENLAQGGTRFWFRINA